MQQLQEELSMALYELRTYTLHVGKMAEAVKIGFPALQKGGQDKKLIRVFPERYRHNQSTCTSLEIRR
jgi:hypothetical protein